MEVHAFLFTNTSWWIEYIGENEEIVRVDFENTTDLKAFIDTNNLGLLCTPCGF